MLYRPEDLAYIAGILDGEGYIGLVKHIEKRSKRETIYYDPVVNVSMTNKLAIDFINSLFEGNIWFSDKGEKTNRKGIFEWVAKGQKRTKEILEAVLPFLKVKKEQAVTLLRFIERREKISHKIKWGETSYTKEDNKYYNEIRKLNHRGR